MPDLLCLCGHPVTHAETGKGHSNNGCLHGWPRELTCECTLTEAQALRAAQRKAAIGHLRKLAEKYRLSVSGYKAAFDIPEAHGLLDHISAKIKRDMNTMRAVYLGYCAVGIFERRK